MISTLIKNDHFKICAESLKVLSQTLKIINKYLNNKLDMYKGQIQELLPTVITILEKADVDQEIKHAII